MRRGNSSSTWRGRCGTNRATPKFSSACSSTWAAKPGDYVETEILWRCTQAEDPAARVAGINRGLEGLACDVFEQLIRIAQRNGDEVIERAVDYVLADEITHVRMGSKWMRKLTEGDPERLQRAQAFQEMVDEVFNFRGGRRAQRRYRDDDGMLLIDREGSADAGGIHRRGNPAAGRFGAQERRVLDRDSSLPPFLTSSARPNWSPCCVHPRSGSRGLPGGRSGCRTRMSVPIDCDAVDCHSRGSRQRA